LHQTWLRCINTRVSLVAPHKEGDGLVCICLSNLLKGQSKSDLERCYKVVWKWSSIVMQLVTYFPQSMRGHNAIWMIIGWLINEECTISF